MSQPRTADQLPAGALVKWAAPTSEEEAQERYYIIEQRGAAILVTSAHPDFDSWRIRPTHLFRTIELIEA